jgi:Uma2 family endonuclease
MSPLPIDAIAPPVLGPESAGMLMTPEEFDEVTEYDDGLRYELIRGVLVVAPIPAESESGPNDELGSMLRQYQREHPQGGALGETLPERYIRTATGRRRADRVIWVGLGRRPDPAVDTPAIAVEFVSASRRDRRRDYSEKRFEYREAGVVEHWIVDRFLRKMTVYRNSPQHSSEVIVTEQETYQTPLLPGFELPLSRLLAVADRWG